MSCVIDFTG